MTGAFRTHAGGRIDRSRPPRLHLRWPPLQGMPGDTLASALLANGVHLVGRSFKYHRPRGILSAGSEEPNALVTIVRGGGRDDAEPARHRSRTLRRPRRAKPEPLAVARLRCRRGQRSCSRRCSRPASTTRPSWARRWFDGHWAWAQLYEPLIRRAAGLGTAPHGADPDHYASRFAHCDVLVVGAGPAGLAAALAACRERRPRHPLRRASGARRLAARRAHRGDRRQARASTGAVTRSQCLRQRDNVTLLPRTTKPSAISRRISSASPSASPITSPRPTPASRASASGRSAPARSCSRPAPSSGRWCSQAMTGPASCWPTRRAPTSTATPCSLARAPWC